MEKKDKFAYFFIVLCGFLAFFLATVFLSKVKNAEAATESDFTSSYSGQVDTSIFISQLPENSDSTSDNTTILFIEGSFKVIVGSCSVTRVVTWNNQIKYEIVLLGKVYNFSESFELTYAGGNESTFITLDAKTGYVAGVLPAISGLSIASYVPIAPPISFDLNSSFFVLDRFYYANNSVLVPPRDSALSSNLNIQGHIANAEIHSGSYDVDFDLIVWLPSVVKMQEFYLSYLDKYSGNVYNTDSAYQAQRNLIQNWRNNVNNSISLRLPLHYTFSAETDIDEINSITVEVTFEQIAQAFQDKMGMSIQYFYGENIDLSYFNPPLSFIMMFLTPVQLRSVVYHDGLYGRMVVNEILNYKKLSFNTNLEYTKVSIDEDFQEIEDLSGVIRDKVTDSLRDEISNRDDLIGNLHNTVDAMQTVDGVFEDYGTSDIFKFIKSTASGLLTLVDSISSLAAIVSIAFSFLPVSVNALIISVFMIILLSTILKAIRG